MKKQKCSQFAGLEKEKRDIISLGEQQMSDELKKAVDLAYELSVKKPLDVKVETLTSGSCNSP